MSLAHVAAPRLRTSLLTLATLAALVVGLVPQPVLATPVGPLLAASMTDALVGDGNSNSQADPGDTLRYTTTVTNSGNEDATGAGFDITPDANSTLVGGFDTTPIARDDDYTTVGNVQLSVDAASGLLANDSDPDGGSLSVAASSATSQGGTLSVAADGAFTYDPPTGFDGTDTFTYTVVDEDLNIDPATVSIDVGPVVWFIDNNVAGPGTGRFSDPFSSIANFNSLAADEAGDYIFIHRGSGSAYGDSITLLNSQQLIGEANGLTISPNLAIPAGSAPTIHNVTLASGNTVRGLAIGTTTGTGMSGASVGALTVSGVSISNTGGIGLSLAGGISSMSAVFSSVSASGGVNGIVLTNNAGSVTVNGGTIDPTTGHGVSVSNTATGPLNLTLSNMTITGAPSGFDGVNLAIPSSGSFGTVTLSGDTFSSNGRAGVRADVAGTGTVTMIDVDGNTFTDNNFGFQVSATGVSDAGFSVTDNSLAGTGSQVILQASASGTGTGPDLEGRVSNNSPIASSAGYGVYVGLVGDGDIVADISNNTITNYAQSGIAALVYGGSGSINAGIADNSVSTITSSVVAGVVLQSGSGPTDTNLMCAHLDGNAADNGSSPFADYELTFGTGSPTFQIQGLAPSPATAAQTEAFVISTDSAPPATAHATRDGYTSATCTAPSLPAGGTSELVAMRSVAFAGSVGPSAPADAAMVQPAAVADVNLGTLNAGQSVTITFDVTINSPLPGTTTEVCAQGTVSSSELADVLTDDPDVGGSADPTCTPVNPGGGADGTPPSVGDVALGLRLGGKIGSAPIQLTWTATDDISDQSALVSEVQLRRLKGALWTAWKPLKTTSDQFLNGKLPFWRTFEYRVRSQDEAGNWSGWAYSEDVLLLRRQERHFSFSGSWSRVADSHAMKGYMSVSSSPGDSASLAFEGNAAAAVMPANAALGSAEVCVDPGTGSEQCTTVDLGTFSPSGNKRLVAAFNDLAEGAHTLRVTVVSGTVKLDGAVLSQNPGFGTCLAPSTDVGPSC